MILQHQRIAFVGKLASMARRGATQLARQHGATVLEGPDASARLIVVGEEEFPLLEAGDQDDWFNEATRRQIEAEEKPAAKKLKAVPPMKTPAPPSEIYSPRNT